MSNQRYNWGNSQVKDFSHALGLKMESAVQRAITGESTKKSTPKNPEGEIPDEQIEEAEQDATDPTHEKEIPPEN
jgi:hypothetical protein